MNYSNKKIAGFLFYVGVFQFILSMLICESVYSGYSVRQQAMSDLGNWSLAGNYAAIFNVSNILEGLFIIAGAYFIQRIFTSRLFTSLFAIAGVGGVGIGVFAEDISLPIHNVFALVAFFSGVAAAIMAYKFLKSPVSYLSVFFGAVELLAFVFFILGQGDSVFYLGLGFGGMQRFMFYPGWIGSIAFGAYLIGDSSETSRA
jgi:hypothetical membrane protein